MRGESPLAVGGGGMMQRHASFDPRSGTRHRRDADLEAPPASNAAWAKLVARTQSLEEALASERASRRLLAARSAQEKVELLAKVGKANEDRESMEHLWKDAKQQLENRKEEWETERSGLFQELARLRMALKAVGADTAVPPSQPPSNLAAALREEQTSAADETLAEESEPPKPTGGDPGGGENGGEANSSEKGGAAATAAAAKSSAASSSAAAATRGTGTGGRSVSGGSGGKGGSVAKSARSGSIGRSSRSGSGGAEVAKAGKQPAAASSSTEEQQKQELLTKAADISSMSSTELASRAVAAAGSAAALASASEAVQPVGTASSAKRAGGGAVNSKQPVLPERVHSSGEPPRRASTSVLGGLARTMSGVVKTPDVGRARRASAEY